MSETAKVAEGCGGYRRFRNVISDWCPLLVNKVII